MVHTPGTHGYTTKGVEKERAEAPQSINALSHKKMIKTDKEYKDHDRQRSMELDKAHIEAAYRR